MKNIKEFGIQHRLLAGLLCLCMIMSMLGGAGLLPVVRVSAAGEEKDLSEDFDITLEVWDDDEKLEKDPSDNSYHLEEGMNYTFKVKFEAQGMIENKTKYTYKLHDALCPAEPFKMKIKDNNDVTVGTMTVDTDGTVTVEFNEKVEDIVGLYFTYNVSKTATKDLKDFGFDDFQITVTDPDPKDINDFIEKSESLPSLNVQTELDYIDDALREAWKDFPDSADPMGEPFNSHLIWKLEIQNKEIVGKTIEDNLNDYSDDNTTYTNSFFEDDDKGRGILVRVKHPNNKEFRHWFAIKDATYNETKDGMSFTVPEKVYCIHCGEEIELNDIYNYEFYYTSTIPTESRHSFRWFINTATLPDGITKDESTPTRKYGDTPGAVIIKNKDKDSDKYNEVQMVDGKITWDVKVTLPASTSYKGVYRDWWFKDEMLFSEDNTKNGTSTKPEIYNALIEGATVTVEAEDGTPVTVEKLSADANSDYVYEIKHHHTDESEEPNVVEIHIYSRCDCEEGDCTAWDTKGCGYTLSENSKYCKCWHSDKKVTFTFTYQTTIEQILAALAKDGKDSSDYRDVLRWLRNEANLRVDAPTGIEDGYETAYDVDVDYAWSPLEEKTDVLKKDVKSVESGLQYTITINESKLDLSKDMSGNDLTGNDDSVTLTDTMTDDVKIDWDSFALTCDGIPMEGESFKLTKKDDKSFELEIKHPGQHTYVLSYIVYVKEGNKKTLTNEATVTMMKKQFTVKNEEKAETSGESGGYQYKAIIEKVDAENPGKHLPGAEYKIYKEGAPETYITVTTDEDGFATVTNADLVKGGIKFEEHAVYCIKETKAPLGYELDAEKEYKFFFCKENEGDCSACSGMGEGVTRIGKDSDGFIKNLRLTDTPVGTLVVTKKVTGDAGDTSKDFTFTVELTGSISGNWKDTVELKFSGDRSDEKDHNVSWNDGKLTFELKHGESLTIENLPVGTKYKVTESNADGYTTSVNGEEGTITEGTISKGFMMGQADFVNDRPVPKPEPVEVDLQLEKYLEDKTVSYNWEEHPFEFIIHAVSVNGSSSTRPPLPDGSADNRYTVSSSSGTPVKGEDGIYKLVVQLFKNIEFTEAGKYVYEITERNRHLNGVTYDRAVYTFTVEVIQHVDNETATATLEVETKSLERADSSIADSEKWDKDVIVFNNKYERTVSVPVEANKVLNGKMLEGGEFSFTLTGQADGEGAMPPMPAGGESGSLTVTNGEDGKVTFGSIEYTKTGKYTYTLKEESTGKFGTGFVDYDDAEFTVEVNVTEDKDEKLVADVKYYKGETPVDAAEVIFTNKYHDGSITVTKEVTGTLNDWSFDFTLKLTDAGGKAVSGTFGGVEFENGQYTFKLSSTDKTSMTFTGIPYGVHYEVTETSTGDYDTTVNGTSVKNASGMISETTPSVKVTFTNEYHTGSLKVTKKVEPFKAGASTLTGKTFSFTLTLTNPDGTPLTKAQCTPVATGATLTPVESKEGVYAFSLKDGETITITGLPIGTEYKVEEAEDPDIDYKVTPENGVVEDTVENSTPIVVDFVNKEPEPDTAELQIRKTVTGVATDEEFEFMIKLTYNGGTLPGEYDTNVKGLKIKSGDTFTLKDGETLTISGLPVGTVYTITETKYGKYKPVGGDVKTGTLEAGTTSLPVEFENHRDAGKLTVTKEVTGLDQSMLDLLDWSFKFKITLKDGETLVNKKFTAKYGEGSEEFNVEFVNGETEVTLTKDHPSVTIEGLPAGAAYTVTEISTDDNYEKKATKPVEGTIAANDTVKVNVENVIRTGSLTVEKSVTGPAESDWKFEVTITLELNKKPLSGTFTATGLAEGTTLTFKNGEATVWFDNDHKTVKIEGLPYGTTYTVTETESDDYVENVSTDNTTYKAGNSAAGTVNGTNVNATVSFRNDRRTGDLTVIKSIDGESAPARWSFTFTITLTNAPVNGMFGDVEFKNGIGSFTLTEEKTSVNITELPAGVEYTVTETPDDKYDVQMPENATGKVTEGTDPIRITFVNKFRTGSLTIDKTVANVGPSTPETWKFTFTVTLNDILGNPVSGTFKATYGTGEPEDITFDEKGEATVTLSNDKPSVTITGLPEGIDYTVEEDGDARFDSKNLTLKSGAISTDAPAKVSFENTLKTGGLTVEKTVTGELGETERLWHFTVTLSDESIDGTYGGMTFTKGIADFTLKHGQHATATGLPAGIKYTVVEKEAGQDDYKTDKTGDEGTIEHGKTAAAKFINEKPAPEPETGSLTVKKTVAGEAGETDRYFNFTVTLSDKTVSGTFGEMTFADGVATFTLKHGETKTASGLPAGVGYTVIEDDANTDGYKTTFTGASGTITKDGVAIAEFTNTKPAPKVGDLTVTKIVEGDEGDTTKSWHFTVTLSDMTISGTFGEMTFTDGVATFTLKHGQHATATGLPAGVKYTVVEKEAGQDGYKTDMTGDEGTIENGEVKTAEFVNTKQAPEPETGSLTVKKTVAGEAGETDRYFSFTVTLSDTTISGTFGDMTFVNGVATFTLKHGETRTASGLPAGVGYTVTEAEADQDGYATDAAGDEGTITKDGVAIAEFTNTKPAPKVGDLTVTKIVEGDEGDTTKNWHFTVTLSDGAINGTYGDMTFVNGVAEFTLKHGESKTATGLPAGVTYKVVEKEAGQDGYKTDMTGDEGTIDNGEVKTAEFVNTKQAPEPETGSLTVKKTVAGEAGETDRAFNFTVTLSDKTVNGTFGDMTFVNGVATFTLKHDESKTASGLPAGVQYTVTEAEADQDGYATDAAGDEGTITKDGVAIAEFTNTKPAPEPETGSLTVTKTVTGTGGDKNKDWHFTVTFEGDTDADFSEVTVSKNGKVDPNLKIVDGKLTFTLKDGETVEVTNLPAGVRYAVTEAEANQGGYTTGRTGETGTILKDQTAEARFTNDRRVGSLTVSKTVTGAAGETDRDFHFTVKFDAEVDFSEIAVRKNGTVDTSFTVMNGVLMFTLKHNETVEISNIPAGVNYTVTETEDGQDGYSTGKTGDTGTIRDGETSSASFINTKPAPEPETGSLTVSKTVTGNDGETTRNFHFTVTLSDTTVNGVYSDMTFVNGVATFTLKHGETKTATGLPAGITYTVAETEANTDSYTTNVTGGTGAIPAGDGVSAGFVNNRDIPEPAVGDLTVTKTVTGNAGDTRREFTFTVTLSDTTVNGVYGSMTFVNGVATFHLRHGESKTATGLPAGITYKVTEAEADEGGYTTGATGDTGTIPEDGTARAEFVNNKDNPPPEPGEGSLTVTKTVAGNATNTMTRFTFMVTLSDTSINGWHGDMEFINGVATFTLRHGESATATGLPAGVTYTVTEAEPEEEGYIVTSTGETGTIPDGGTAEADFVNYRNVTIPDEGPKPGPLAVRKLVTGEEGELDREFHFTVTLSDKTINGVYGDMVFVNGVAEFTLKSGEVKWGRDIPIGTRYEIVEAEANTDGYDTIIEGEVGGIIQSVRSEVRFHNHRGPWTPDDDIPWEDIPDPDIPLGDIPFDDLPQTGDENGTAPLLVMLFVSMSGAALTFAATAPGKKRRAEHGEAGSDER